MSLDDVTREDVSRLVAGVCSGEWSSRLRCLEQLNELTAYGRLMRIGLSESEVVALVRAAGESWPTVEDEDAVRRLLLCACSSPHAACLPELLALYPRLERNEWAQWQGLLLLSFMPQREAAEQWVRWYRELWQAGRGSPPPLDYWPRAGLHADVILPALLEFADTSRMPSPDDCLADRLIDCVTAYFKSGHSTGAVNDWAIAESDRAIADLPTRTEPPFSTSRWSDPFPRYKAAQLLTLLGFAGGPQARKRLRAASGHDDPRVACAAVLGLVRLGQGVSSAALERVASDPETRRELYDVLRAAKRSRLFPRAWRSQQRLAESDMVSWLIADVDAAPDELRLLERIEAGGARHYVFEFRYLPPHAAAKDGWMAGVSGPWPARGLNKLDVCGGGTVSRFDRADEFTPLEHLRRNGCA